MEEEEVEAEEDEEEICTGMFCEAVADTARKVSISTNFPKVYSSPFLCLFSVFTFPATFVYTLLTVSVETNTVLIHGTLDLDTTFSELLCCRFMGVVCA